MSSTSESPQPERKFTRRPQQTPEQIATAKEASGEYIAAMRGNPDAIDLIIARRDAALQERVRAQMEQLHLKKTIAEMPAIVPRQNTGDTMFSAPPVMEETPEKAPLNVVSEVIPETVSEATPDTTPEDEEPQQTWLKQLGNFFKKNK